MRNMKLLLANLLLMLLASCASYSDRLKPGVAMEEDVVRVMGAPAMRWQNPDSSAQLAYPYGPRGLHTYMVFIAPEGKLQRIENVLSPKFLALVQPGMTQEEVLRTLGPPYPFWTSYFQSRDELAWEWRYCDDWNNTARFDVLFDNTKGTVRSSMSLPDEIYCPRGGCKCSR
jgi:hypothetical protein